jgi:hypothetical protein
MQKYGSPEPVRTVLDPAERDADEQGIDVTATRRAPAPTQEEILQEGDPE